VSLCDGSIRKIYEAIQLYLLAVPLKRFGAAVSPPAPAPAKGIAVEPRTSTVASVSAAPLCRVDRSQNQCDPT